MCSGLVCVCRCRLPQPGFLTFDAEVILILQRAGRYKGKCFLGDSEDHRVFKTCKEH